MNPRQGDNGHMRIGALALVVLATIALASATSSAAPETKLPFHWRQPSWSPSGKALAFGGGSNLSYGLFRSAPTGKHLRPIAVEAMAHLFVAALSEAAFVIAYADRPRKTRAEVEEALVQLVEGLRA